MRYYFWMHKRRSLFFFCMLAVLIALLARVDRLFFKRNNSFSIRFLYTCLPNDPRWDLPTLTENQRAELSQILSQKFYYLAKGAHCYAFISEDKNYVIKFHRYPSHMRIFPWLNHPFSYQFSERRKKIKAHNIEKLQVNLRSYMNSYHNLQDETGLILLHINRSQNIKHRVRLVDKTRAEYQIPLDDVTFILQKRADLIYPTLDRLTREKKHEEAKQVVSHIIELILSCCQKGYVDEDPVLKKNYGLLPDRAIHIDVGDLIRKNGIEMRENYIPHVKEITESLRIRLENDYPELIEHYYQTIEQL